MVKQTRYKETTVAILVATAILVGFVVGFLMGSGIMFLEFSSSVGS